MDQSKPYKVVKTPTAHGVVAGVLGEVIFEAEFAASASAILYQTTLDDQSTAKGIHYTYDIVEWGPTHG